MGSLFSSSKSSSPKLLEPAWQTQLRQSLSNAAQPAALNRIASLGQPYGGELISGINPYESGGLDLLREYLSSPLTSQMAGYQQGKGVLTDYLADTEDPFASKYYEAYRSNVMRELSDAKERLAGRMSAKDKLFSGGQTTGRTGGESNLEISALGQLMEKMGALGQENVGNRLNVAQLLMALSGAENQESLQRSQASTTGGSYLRSILDAIDQAKYGEFQRQLADKNQALQLASQISMYQPQYYVPSYGPSAFSQLASPLLGAAGMAGGFGNLFSGLGGMFGFGGGAATNQNTANYVPW